MATGSSPLGIYAEMRKNKLDTSRVTTVNLDEYVNLPHEDKTAITISCKNSCLIIFHLNKLMYQTDGK